MIIRMRGRLPLVWLGVVGLLAVLLPHRIWMTLLVGLGGMLGIGYWWAWQLGKGLQGERRLRFGWVAVGDRLVEAFTVVNDSLVPAFWVEVVDDSNVPGYRPGVVRSIRERQVDSWQQEAICERRGQFRLGPWGLRSADPFGIFEVEVRLGQMTEVVIHPPIHTALPFLLPAGHSDGRIRAREQHQQATLNVSAIRQYQPSDPFRWIHWRTSARQAQLMVRQFELDAAGDIWFLLDLQGNKQVGTGAQGTEEHMVVWVASLAVQALQENRGVGLASYGLRPVVIHPGRGQGQQWKLLQALALVEADGQVRLSRALQDLSRLAKRGSAAVLFTATDEAGWLPDLLQLQRLGVRCSVVVLDRESFGGVGDPSGLHYAIRQMGVTSTIVQQGELGKPTQTQQKRGHWEFRTTAMGKVVVVSRPGE